MRRRLSPWTLAVALKAGRHAIRLQFAPARSPVLEVRWAGPGTPRQPVPAAALCHVNQD